MAEEDAFPDPISVDCDVDGARQQRLSDLTYITLVGIWVRLIIVVVEAAGVIWSDSSALFVDAISSLFDVISSLVLLAAIRFAARPPDLEHPFGHGRVEPLAGFQLGLLLCGSGVWLGWSNAIAVAGTAPHRDIPGWTWLIPAAATLALAVVTWLIYHAGKRTRSSALKAESLHFLVDALTSVVAAVALLAASLLPQYGAIFDHAGGILLSLVMMGIGLQAANENLHQLLDRVPREEDFERVRKSASKVEGVIDVEKMRIQHAGPDAHVNIDIEVAPEVTVADGHKIAQKVRAQIQTDWPFVREVVVHVEPYYPGDH
ncbi:cation diffusion facilitator family transporter [Planctomicrobium sp. SH527]|uniref:cation diffusion facilitator family transporter n=1 Tax=Planctomicrobium sp. SH527 TaxID=3448123 RepID=UPI003F5BC383